MKLDPFARRKLPASDANPVSRARVLPKKQERKNWCWAACISMILSRGVDPPSPSQCRVAQKKFPSLDCCGCGDATHECECDKTLRVDQIADLIDGFGLSVSEIDNPVFENFRKSIEDDRVPVLGVLFDKHIATHVVLAYGCDSVNKKLWIADPLNPDTERVVKFSSIATEAISSQGVWGLSFFVNRG